jgi:hypothetical protein
VLAGRIVNSVLTNLAEGLWIADGQFTNELGHVTTRMAVIRLADRRVLIHSPVPIEPNLSVAVSGLGDVSAIIASNLFHHQFISQWQSAFPNAKVFCAPGLESKRSDIRFEGVFDNIGPSQWREELDHILIDGIPAYSEVVFFHRASRTLLVSDIVFNYTAIEEAADPGGAKGLGPHERIKAAVSDPKAARNSIVNVLRWPFERVIVTHGNIVECGGNALFREGFAFLLDE